MSPLWLVTGTLVFTTTSYFLLKHYLIEWGCRKFLKGRVRINSDLKTIEANQNGHAHVTNGMAAGMVGENGHDNVTVLSKGMMAEIAEL